MIKVLLLYKQMIPSVRLCAYSQLCYLAEAGEVAFESVEIKNVTAKQLRTADVVVSVRGDSAFELLVAKKVLQAGRTFLYVIDDDLLAVPEYIAASTFYNIPSTRCAIQALLEQCSYLLSPSPQLLSKYGRDSLHSVRIEEPALNALPTLSPFESNRPLRIGFAGSVDRTQDVEALLGEAIRRIVQDYPERVTFEFMGARPNFVNELSLTHYPYEDSYDTYQQRMKELNWDIGLAPMPITEFHSYKHYNKFVEYAALGIVGIYSNTMPYCNAVVHKQTGFLCNNTAEDWYRALAHCIENPAQVYEMKKMVLDTSQTKFAVATCARPYRELLAAVQPSSKRVSAVGLQWVRVCCFITRLCNFVQVHRGRALCVAWGKIFGSAKR